MNNTGIPADPVLAVHEPPALYTVSRYKHSRHWAIHDPDGALVCVALYKKGATEVVRRLSEIYSAERKDTSHVQR
jgi:hypothetical protein